jgi:hypothetical protein
MVTLGGISATVEEVAQVLDALYDAPGDHMRRYLKGTPLEGMDYHKIHDEEIELFPRDPGAAGDATTSHRPCQACLHPCDATCA